ncbi:MAG: acyl-CoA dehydrogenase family protein [Deltaproteobacteria bacterium]|nr:acyl-CoA dehydrogenase family protein [Deltaproteobacteria bacterium]
MERQNDPTERQGQIRELTFKIARERIALHAAECDRSGNFPREAIRCLGEAGLPGLIISEAEGGAGEGRACFASVVQEIARACASTALIYTSHVVAAKAIEVGGSGLLKKKWLTAMMGCQSLGAFAVHEPDSGSNAGAITTRAIRDGDFYVVNGSKFFITSGGEADVYLVLVRTDPEKGPQGMSTLLIEKDTPGLSFGKPEDKMGLRSTSSREMFFSDCRVPVENLIGNEGEGLQIIGKSLVGWGFYGAAAISVGIAQAAVEASIRHAKERTIAGQPIGVHQAVQFMVSDMILGSESAEAYLHSSAAKADASPAAAALNGFKAKLFASEMAVEVTNKAIQVLGGHGYSREYRVERLFRDARGLTLHFKTSEWLRQDVAKAALGI